MNIRITSQFRLRGTIRDATFIEGDPGSSEKNPRCKDAKSRRSKDGTWTKKGNKSYFRYKLHQKTDIDYCLIREMETTTVKVHDSQIDLFAEGEVAFRDRDYFGAKARVLIIP